MLAITLRYSYLAGYASAQFDAVLVVLCLLIRQVSHFSYGVLLWVTIRQRESIVWLSVCVQLLRNAQHSPSAKLPL